MAKAVPKYTTKPDIKHVRRLAQQLARRLPENAEDAKEVLLAWARILDKYTEEPAPPETA